MEGRSGDMWPGGGGGGGRGSTHELVRDDNVFVCLWEQFTCI